MRNLQTGGRRAAGMGIVLVLFCAVGAAVGLAGCGGSGSDVAATAHSTASSASGMVLPGGGLSVAEAIATKAEPPLAVAGWVVGSDAHARLCSGYNAGASQPCIEPSLALKGAGEAKDGTQVSLLGAVQGDTFVVSPTVQG